MKLFKSSLTNLLIVCTLILSPQAIVTALLGTLGDLYDQTGRSELAIETYRKALAIDPTLEKAKAGLKKHGH